MGISLFLLPSIPGWIYGLLFVLISIAGIRSRADNIGHDAHLGGAIVGMLIALAIYPSSLRENYLVIGLIALR